MSRFQIDISSGLGSGMHNSNIIILTNTYFVLTKASPSTPPNVVMGPFSFKTYCIVMGKA